MSEARVTMLLEQLGLILAVPAVLLGAVWLGVLLVRWAKRDQHGAANAALDLYVAHEASGLGSLLRSFIDD